MKEDTKDILRGIAFVSVILITMWLLAFTNHAYPEFDEPEGFVGSHSPKADYFLPVMLTILFGGIYALGIIVEEDKDERAVWDTIVIPFLAIMWSVVFMAKWDMGDFWYVVPLKVTIFIGFIIGMVISLALISVWSDR